ncbi:hypothetical protein EPA93_24790 [Ktedonosporobacter rubrisoli]|uniref:Uncharacterized protein n=1 Tax=Ktedonosporobacter rubrisoli TaxID=2509675 RepID=A0A4P6JUK0_KTERU|nr:hypothetical protein [Ktedonosporobacter rubrisoli]QBD79025.1 hypothetical protein EPA93_24790 [Ktedonosporobacter rubrisoli]
MRETITARNTLVFTGAALAATAGALLTLGGYVRREIERRGYPSWEDCRCSFKSNQTIFQVWYSRQEQRGETIVSQEWGSYLSNPPQWVRRFLHHGSQVLATLNPRGRYVERIALSPQEAHRFVTLLHTASAGEAHTEEFTDDSGHMVWRREILHVSHHPLDAYVRRLYPSHVAQERSAQAQTLPAVWDPHRNLPLPIEGSLLETPTGTRIDYIGWTPAQISYCTARLKP